MFRRFEINLWCFWNTVCQQFLYPEHICRPIVLSFIYAPFVKVIFIDICTLVLLQRNAHLRVQVYLFVQRARVRMGSSTANARLSVPARVTRSTTSCLLNVCRTATRAVSAPPAASIRMESVSRRLSVPASTRRKSIRPGLSSRSDAINGRCCFFVQLNMFTNY